MANNKHEPRNSIIKILFSIAKKRFFITSNTTAPTFKLMAWMHHQAIRGEIVHVVWCPMPDTYSIMSRVHTENDLWVKGPLAAKNKNKITRGKNLISSREMRRGEKVSRDDDETSEIGIFSLCPCALVPLKNMLNYLDIFHLAPRLSRCVKIY